MPLPAAIRLSKAVGLLKTLASIVVRDLGGKLVEERISVSEWTAALRCFTAAKQTKKPVTSEISRVLITASWSVRASCLARTVNLGLTADTGSNL